MKISCKDYIRELCAALYFNYYTISFSILCMMHPVTYYEAIIISKQTFLKIHQ